ncbi:MAG: hypothetical protein ACHP9S_10610 [Terriglobales bacterium]
MTADRRMLPPRPTFRPDGPLLQGLGKELSVEAGEIFGNLRRLGGVTPSEAEGGRAACRNPERSQGSAPSLVRREESTAHPAESNHLREFNFALAVDASRLNCYIQKVLRVKFGLLVAAEFHP